jgi:F-type H+-transporting ATPase subunit b
MNYAEFSVELGQVSAMSMVDVDMTALVSSAIFIVVSLLLNALLIQPYLRIVRERAAPTTGAQDAADETADKAAALLTEYKNKLTGARTDAGEIRDGLRSDGRADESRIVSAAREQAVAALATKRLKLEKEVAAAQAQLEERSTVLSQAIVARVVS